MNEAAVPCPIPKPNRRTLRSRVRRMIYLTSLINIVLFTVIMLGFLSLLLRPISGFASGLITQSIASEMNSEVFLKQQNIPDLAHFDPSTAKGGDWVQMMDHRARLDNYIPKDVQLKTDQALERHSPTVQFNSAFEFVTMEVTIGDRTVYSNAGRQMNMSRMGALQGLIDYFTVRTSSDLTDAAGTKVGEVAALISPEVVLAIYALIAFILLALVLASLMLTKVVTALFSKPVLLPLDQAIAKMKELSQESAAWDNPIRIVRPMHEIEQLANATNLIMSKMKMYSEQLEQQKTALEEQNEELEAQNEDLLASELQLQEAQDKLLRSDRSIRSLLDNAGQGFLTFGPNLLVNEEYSRECRTLFGADIAGVPFPQLLARGDEEQRKFLESLLQKLFVETDPHRRAMYMPLLTDEFHHLGKHMKLEYKMIDAGGGAEALMVILTDITEKRVLESQVEVERNILKMVVKVIVGYGDFTDCVRDFKLFAEVDLPAALRGDESVKAKLLSIYRNVHTYKGNFSQFGLTHIVRKLHEAETQLSAWLKTSDSLSANDVADCIGKLGIGTWLDDDLAVLQSVIGDSFFNQDDLLMIDKTKIIDIEKKMLAILSPNECKLLLPELRKLRYKPFKELLRGYPDYVQGLAERMEKLVLPFTIQGDDDLADTEKYYDFSRSLVHVFRNILDHAVETPEERIEQGKEEFASIFCRTALDGDRIVVEITDDGRGIDAALIRHKAVERGIISEAEAAALGDTEAIGLIFRDEFSTKEEVSDISGRGIGLAAVKAEVDKLGGSIDVLTEVGRGTVFRFALPYEELDAAPQLVYPDMLQPSLATVKQYFEQFVGVRLEGDETFALHPCEKLPLKKVTAFVTLKGAVEGMFVVTVDEPLSRAIVRGIVLDALTADEEARLVEDSLAETANTILGNSFAMFRQFADFVLMESPITIETEGASIKYADADIWACALHSGHGAMEIGFVLTKRG